VLLLSTEYADNTVTSLGKIVWQAARNQFKYMLAINDVLIKAERQLQNSEDEQSIYEDMQSEKIEFEYAKAIFDLTADSFWTLFTEPSLKVLLHYSVNSYTDSKVEIRSPLSTAALLNDRNQTNSTATGEADDKPRIPLPDAGMAQTEQSCNNGSTSFTMTRGNSTLAFRTEEETGNVLPATMFYGVQSED
jgi:hypothetical protein